MSSSIFCLLFSRGGLIRSIWSSPGCDVPFPASKSWMKHLGLCPGLERLRFDWTAPGSIEDFSVFFEIKSLQRLQINNFDATKEELLQILSSTFILSTWSDCFTSLGLNLRKCKLAFGIKKLPNSKRLPLMAVTFWKLPGGVQLCLLSD